MYGFDEGTIHFCDQQGIGGKCAASRRQLRGAPKWARTAPPPKEGKCMVLQQETIHVYDQQGFRGKWAAPVRRTEMSKKGPLLRKANV